jgi:adenosylhomocysteine nucleosidase
VGDVVIADAVAVHDAGACRQDGFDPTGIALLNGTGRHCSARRLLSSTEMRDLATKVAARIPWGLSRGGLPPRVHAGTIVTGDQVIFSAEKKEWLRNTFDAVAVEMEGSAFAQVAEANGVPWLLIRAVSDQADHYLDFPFELWRDYVDDAQTPRAQLERTIQRLSYVAMNPKTPLKAKRFLSLLNYAANNAARLTEAVVAAL